MTSKKIEMTIKKIAAQKNKRLQSGGGVEDKVVDDAGKSAMEKTHNMVQVKKAAAGDTGTGNSVNVSGTQKGNTFSEMFKHNVEEAGKDW